MYDIVQLIGVLGGVTGVLTLVLGFFILPISEASFIMKSAKRMFLVKTKDEEIFNVDTKKKSIGKFIDMNKMPESLRNNKESGINYHRIISLKRKDKICFYLSHTLGQFFCCKCCWKNNIKINKLFSETNKRLLTELDIVKLIRNIRSSKILLNNSLMNE